MLWPACRWLTRYCRTNDTSPGSQTARYTQTHMLVYTTTTITTILWPLYRSTYISRHLQLGTGGFCWCKVLHAHMLAYVVSLSLGILHECTRTQMLAEPSSALLQRTGGDHRGGRGQLGWRTFMMICLRWILGYTRLEIWWKIGLSGDWCLCTAICTCSGACYYWTGKFYCPHAPADINQRIRIR